MKRKQKLKTPNKVKIWGHDFRVSKQKDPRIFDGKNNPPVLGYFLADDQRIVLKSSLAKQAPREVETLLHEILHGIAYFSNAFGMMEDKHKVEEHIVDTFANGITLILRDNPELVDYIKEGLHGSSDIKVE